jgi:hypothetical protein
MFVYIWKDPAGVPFYVGMGSTLGRASPKAKRHRNKECVRKLQELGADAVVVEIHTVADEDAAKHMEQLLIAKYKRLRDGGTLTNLSGGGEFHRATPQTKEKLSELWKHPDHRVRAITPRIGLKRTLPESTKQALRKNLAANPAMLSWAERNGKDSEFDAKRIAGIKAAQPKRREKMSDPVALAQRKARVTATMNSPEFKARRAQWDTPEYREKLAAAKREFWAKKRKE